MPFLIEENFESDNSMDGVGDHVGGHSSPELGVVDVYDIASDIGKEFEKLIDSYGSDSISSLMPKVIGVLEQLESFATKNERENILIQDLRTKVLYLEHEKLEKAECKSRYEREMEQIEDNWREESKDLLCVVSRLRDENRKLLEKIAEKEGSQTNGAIYHETDIQALQHLQFTSEKYREKNCKLEREVEALLIDKDNIQCQWEQLSQQNKELRRRQKAYQLQMRTLVEERAELQAELQEKSRQCGNLRQRLGVAQKENEDLITSKVEVEDMANKITYDVNDPDRPRFTTSELKDLLQERNDLKSRVSDLEEELKRYKPDESCISIACNNSDEEDAPVQGPLPYEPDDAPWKKSESGIRKFFREFFGSRWKFSPNNSPSHRPFPRKSVSSYSFPASLSSKI